MIKPEITTPPDARNALAEIVAGLDGVTPGPWRRKTLGGSSTVLSGVKPPNNDRRAASYGYRDQEYCLAHAFLDDDDRARMDFVCFGHSDAAHIARLDPATIRSIADLVSSQDARIAALEAQIEGMRVALKLAESVLGRPMSAQLADVTATLRAALQSSETTGEK